MSNLVIIALSALTSGILFTISVILDNYFGETSQILAFFILLIVTVIVTLSEPLFLGLRDKDNFFFKNRVESLLDFDTIFSKQSSEKFGMVFGLMATLVGFLHDSPITSTLSFIGITLIFFISVIKSFKPYEKTGNVTKSQIRFKELITILRLTFRTRLIIISLLFMFKAFLTINTTDSNIIAMPGYTDYNLLEQWNVFFRLILLGLFGFSIGMTCGTYTTNKTRQIDKAISYEKDEFKKPSPPSIIRRDFQLSHLSYLSFLLAVGGEEYISRIMVIIFILDLVFKKKNVEKPPSTIKTIIKQLKDKKEKFEKNSWDNIITLELFKTKTHSFYAVLFVIHFGLWVFNIIPPLDTSLAQSPSYSFYKELWIIPLFMTFYSLRKTNKSTGLLVLTIISTLFMFITPFIFIPEVLGLYIETLTYFDITNITLLLVFLLLVILFYFNSFVLNSLFYSNLYYMKFEESSTKKVYIANFIFNIVMLICLATPLVLYCINFIISLLHDSALYAPLTLLGLTFLILAIFTIFYFGISTVKHVRMIQTKDWVECYYFYDPKKVKITKLRKNFSIGPWFPLKNNEYWKNPEKIK